MSGQERRAASTRKRHALNRLQKLEAELANLKAMPGSKLYVDLEGKIAEARKQAGVTKNNLQIKWRSDEPPILEQIKTANKAKQTWTGGGLGLTFSDRYTPKDLKNELGPTPDNKPIGTVKSTAKSNLQINPFDGKTAVHTIPTTTTKPSNSRELRIKNFKPSSIQKKLINSGFTPTELVDLQIKHEDWQKNRGR